jgi:hypothetical protein
MQVKKRQVLTWQRLDEDSSMLMSCVYKFSHIGTMEIRKLEHTNELSGSRKISEICMSQVGSELKYYRTQMTLKELTSNMVKNKYLKSCEI